MKHQIMSIGFEIPGGDFPHFDFFSKASALDYDIILYLPGIEHLGNYSTYQGKPCLSDFCSSRARTSISHWKRELSEAAEAGKLVVCLLNQPEEVFIATGEVKTSGTGRNTSRSRVVELISSYDALPVRCHAHTATGREMILSPKARFFSSYWSTFRSVSSYEAWLDGSYKEPLLTTKAGNRVLGACIRRGTGAILLIPPFDFEQESFTSIQDDGGREVECWTEEGEAFGRKLAGSLVRLARSLATESEATPPPDWVSAGKYSLPKERQLRTEIASIESDVEKMLARKRKVETRLVLEAQPRDLLFEQGKALEKAVLTTLRLFGFEANPFQNGDSEFDAVFVSSEGRLLGKLREKTIGQ